MRQYRSSPRLFVLVSLLLQNCSGFSLPPQRRRLVAPLFSEAAVVTLEKTHNSRIHGVAPRDGPLNQAVASICNVTSLEKANELIAIGAVWARMDPLSEEEVLQLYDDDHAVGARSQYADLNTYDNDDSNDNDLDNYIETMEYTRFRRILSPGWISAGTDLRIYPNPRRFPSASQLDASRLLYQDTTFLVVDKPPMLPTQPDASNYYECVPGAVQDNLGPFTDIAGNEIARPMLCHRVDACVGGVVVLSKDRNGQKVFSAYQQDRKLRKLYLAVTETPVPIGVHIHWMWAPQSTRGKSGGPPCQLIRHTPPASRRKARQFWNRCVLEVVACAPIRIEGASYYQSTIRLVTGRKHQVRAQLASLGCPILRDTLYGPLAGRTLDLLEDIEDVDEDSDEDDNDLDAAIAHCRVPTEPIGLQAHAILFGGIRVKAHPPWWAS
jgi:23S rRNA-/tRNA-specific pseudouridylate synthase